jgi:hypothetical protein
MRKILGMVLFSICFGSLAANAANHSFTTGKLLDVRTDERLMEGTSFTCAIFIVQIDDILYTLQGKRLVSLRARDYGEGLIVGDPVQVSVEGNTVILLRPNGKEFKTSIVKRERAPVK